ncbi:MAG: hypothetical protein JOY80_10190 [Candidatus Dormibacteraeota bacterium]|nr:hypothetical protein [Candidatus Dormibacteraeota bacterium]
MQPTSYETHLRTELQRRLALLPQIARVVVQVEGEFPGSSLLIKFNDARLPDHVLGHYCSIWNDDGSPMYSADPVEGADFIAEVVQLEIERSLKALPRPTEDGITWI